MNVQIEREVAAALESVFPRVGLKAFVQLSYDEKNSQLAELARIVLGIRIFNREQQRGGAGIDFMDKEGLQLANAMVQVRNINQRAR
jgi:D-Tyr-tRNAtyr deacylase